MKNIGLFGITANPPHLGHCIAIKQALTSLDEVYVSLVYEHPFGKKFIEYKHRKAMLELILKEYFEPALLAKIIITEIDKEYFLKTEKIPYSYDILTLLSKKNPSNQFKLIIGEDNYHPDVWNKFYKNDAIEKEFGLVIIEDKGTHSTQIREMFASETPDRKKIISACGQAVFKYMNNHNLYKKE